MVSIQYFKGAELKTMSAIDGLRVMHEKTLWYAAEFFRKDTDDNGKFQINPRRVRISDLQVMSLAIAAESAFIDNA
jgi:hypothetical protein